MVTPFNRQGKISEDGLRNLVDYLMEGEVHGLFPVGSQEEYYALEREEEKRIMQVVLDQAKGKVPIYAGRETITLSKMVEDIGVETYCGQGLVGEKLSSEAPCSITADAGMDVGFSNKQ